MKVKELIKRLKQYDENFEVKFATSPADRIVILSVYDAEEDTVVWFDVEIEEGV